MDIIRGFALLGVCIVNIGNWPHPATNPLDPIAGRTVAFLFEEKSWPLFGLLFGLGVAIQLGRGLTPHLRRMLALYGYGVVTLVLFAGNNILLRYALLGLALIPLRRIREAWLLPLALFMMIFSASFPRIPMVRSAIAAAQKENSANRRLMMQGDFTEGGMARVSSLRIDIRQVAPHAEAFSMILVGFWAGRRRLHEALLERLPLFSALARWVLPVGLAGSAIATFLIPFPRNGTDMQVALYLSGYHLAANLQSIGYAAVIVLLARNERWLSATRRLAAPGQMALTNFMLQFLVFRLLFDRFFFGLQIGVAGCLLIAAVLFGAQLIFSRGWLARYRFGPAEWLWRSFTYWRRPPFVLAAARV